MNDLPDINVWLALIDKRHVHHAAASRYWADASVQSRAFCGTHKSAHGPPQNPAKVRTGVRRMGHLHGLRQRHLDVLLYFS